MLKYVYLQILSLSQTSINLHFDITPSDNNVFVIASVRGNNLKDSFYLLPYNIN